LPIFSVPTKIGGAKNGQCFMTAEELKEIQAPLKAQYQSDPAAAMVTLRARGRVSEGIACKVDTGKSLIEAGLHPATGGNGTQACSGDMLLEALVACAGVTLRAVATAIGVELRDAIITAEGDLDFRGTLAVSKEAPVGFKKIQLRFQLGDRCLGGRARNSGSTYRTILRRAADSDSAARYYCYRESLTPRHIHAALHGYPQVTGGHLPGRHCSGPFRRS